MSLSEPGVEHHTMSPGRPWRLAFLLLLTPAFSLAADDEQRLGDEQVLKSARVGTDGPALLAFFRQRTPTADDLRKTAELVRQLGSPEYSEREKAAHDLVARGPTALSQLHAALRDPDAEVRRRAEQCIAEIEEHNSRGLPEVAARQVARVRPPGAVAVLLDFLPHTDDPAVEDEVLNTLTVLAAAKGPADAALLAVVKDPQPMKRAAAGYALGRRSDVDGEVLPRLLTDSDPKVRLRAAQGAIAGKDRRGVPVLIGLLAEAPPEISTQAEELLWRIAQEKSPTLPSADDPGVRRQYRAAWEKWWKEEAGRIDLARFENKPAFLGLTLVPEMHANKLWEAGPDGKPRWEIDGLAGPIDAQVLPGGRVLVAELNGNRVTERDLSGKIHWKHELPAPIACQRLPNGNTFIATNNALFEFSREGKEAFRYIAENGYFIHSAQRQRNGHVVCISMSGEIREIDAAGKVLVSVRLDRTSGWSGIESVSGGRYLVVENNTGKVEEVDAAGKVHWHFQIDGASYASRLANGNTLVVVFSQNRLVEVDRDGKQRWEVRLSSPPWRAHKR